MKSKELWKHVASRRDFFAELDWMPGGEELWAAIVKCTSQGPAPSILTGLPMGKSLGTQARLGKKKWCAERLGEH
eukprot:COSAG04_NODE_9974_length_816_cov_0.761506_2_plen_74_part_01